jgi:flagellar biosynthesis protein FliQ
MAENDNNSNTVVISRDVLALGMTTVSIVGIIVLCVAIFRYFTDIDKYADKIMTIFTSVLALVGSWVGTILAFYFSKENFESATRNVTALVNQVSPQEKLKSILIKDKMTPKDKMFFVKLPAAGNKLVDMLNNLELSKRGSRIPVLTDKEFPANIVHKSTIVEFLFDKGKIQPPPDLTTFTLQDLLNDAEANRLANNFAVIREDGTLADAKAAMDSKPGCQDVFITKGGTKDEPLTGWLTNNTIAESAVV